MPKNHSLVVRYNEMHRLWVLYLRGAGGHEKNLGYFKTEESARLFSTGYQEGVKDAKLALGVPL